MVFQSYLHFFLERLSSFTVGRVIPEALESFILEKMSSVGQERNSIQWAEA